RRLHLKNKLRCDVVVELDCDFMFPGLLDRALQNNFVSINLCPELVFKAINDVLCGHRTKRSAGFAGLERKQHSRFTNSTRQFLRLVQLARFAFGALRSEGVNLSQTCWSNFMCFAARK